MIPVPPSARTRRSALGLTLFALASLLLGAARAGWTPSADLQFRASVSPDSLTVGDPVTLELGGSAPASGTLLVPAFEDSVGPFTLLGSQDLPGPAAPEGRTAFVRRLRLTAFETGRLAIPPIPLLWISETGDTAVAYSDSLRVDALSVLPESVATADPQTALAQLRDVKGVVTLEPSRLWLWILLGVLGAALLAWILVRALRRKTAAVPRMVAPAPAPALSPEVAFHKGLDALLSRKWIETGEFKEYYAELSLLLRRYIEGRFTIPAVEETQREIVEAADLDQRLDSAEVDWLRGWLRDADLVKFARMDRLSADAHRATEQAATWVLASTKKAEERSREAARLTPPPVPAAESVRPGSGAPPRDRDGRGRGTDAEAAGRSPGGNATIGAGAAAEVGAAGETGAVVETGATETGPKDADR